MTAEMNADINKVWDSCLTNIRNNVNERSFRTWFRPIVPVALDKNVLTVQLPNEFFYKHLEEHYLEVLKQTIRNELGPNARLEYQIIRQRETESANTKRKEKSQEKEVIRNPFVIPGIKKIRVEPQLIGKYTFDNFIEGDCNKLARSAGIRLAESPGSTAFNPLTIYGNSGLGKTHLAHAIGNLAISYKSDLKVLYVSTEKFTNQIIQAIKSGNISELVAFYQDLDLFILDDIHFLANREKTQEILFHIFNQIHHNGKQIVLTSDRPPKDLDGMDERLISRFKWGLSADLTAPDFETRMAIAQYKLEKERKQIPNEVLEYVCFNIRDNIRELEGLLTSLLFQANVTNAKIDIALAESILTKFIEKEQKEINVENIKSLVCDALEMDVRQVAGKSRKRDFVSARQIIMYLSKKYTNASYKEIGESFGGRDHSTVIHACKAVKDQIETNKLFRDKVKKLERDIELTFKK